MFGRWIVLPVTLLLVAAASGCSRSSKDETASLCQDLGNLAETVALIGSPPDDATIGELRGAVQKLEPTIHEAERAGVVPDADGDAFRAAQEEVLAALEDIGDDTAIEDVPAARMGPTDAVASRYRAMVAILGCGEIEA